MRRIAHIVNPVKVGPESDLYVAQPITFETMKIARDYAHGQVDVSLFSAQYTEDRDVIPDHIECTADLERSVMDVGRFGEQRKLPLVRDILERLRESSDADYFIYTNADIAVVPSFYTVIDQIIDHGYDAFSVTRRTISREFTEISQLPLMYAQVGEPHPGTDCFVFDSRVLPALFFADACVGAYLVAKNFQLNLICNSERYKKFTDLHITFHLGDDRVWTRPELDDYSEHNEKALREVVAHYESAQAVPDRYGFYGHVQKSLRRRTLEKRYRSTPFVLQILNILVRLKHRLLPTSARHDRL